MRKLGGGAGRAENNVIVSKFSLIQSISNRFKRFLFIIL